MVAASLQAIFVLLPPHRPRGRGRETTGKTRRMLKRWERLAMVQLVLLLLLLLVVLGIF